MITGLYPSWHGCWTIGVKLPEDVPTVGDEVVGTGGHSRMRASSSGVNSAVSRFSSL